MEGTKIPKYGLLTGPDTVSPTNLSIHLYDFPFFPPRLSAILATTL